jgi:hypothetical protein
MSGMSRSTHRKFIPAVAREIVPMPLTMTARDMGVTFESCPELYRACHPLFDGRQVALPEPETQTVQQTVTNPPESVGYVPIEPASWTWQI